MLEMATVRLQAAAGKSEAAIDRLAEAHGRRNPANAARKAENGPGNLVVIHKSPSDPIRLAWMVKKV